MKYQVTVEEDLREMAAEYLEKRRAEMPEWEALAAAKDIPTLTSHGHRMKGVGESYGFPELTRLGSELEVAGKAGDAAKAAEIITKIKDYVMNVEILAGAA